MQLLGLRRSWFWIQHLSSFDHHRCDAVCGLGHIPASDSRGPVNGEGKEPQHLPVPAMCQAQAREFPLSVSSA